MSPELFAALMAGLLGGTAVPALIKFLGGRGSQSVRTADEVIRIVRREMSALEEELGEERSQRRALERRVESLTVELHALERERDSLRARVQRLEDRLRERGIDPDDEIGVAF